MDTGPFFSAGMVLLLFGMGVSFPSTEVFSGHWSLLIRHQPIKRNQLKNKMIGSLLHSTVSLKCKYSRKVCKSWLRVGQSNSEHLQYVTETMHILIASANLHENAWKIF